MLGRNDLGGASINENQLFYKQELIFLGTSIF